MIPACILALKIDFDEKYVKFRNAVQNLFIAGGVKLLMAVLGLEVLEFFAWIAIYIFLGIILWKYYVMDEAWSTLKETNGGRYPVITG